MITKEERPHYDLQTIICDGVAEQALRKTRRQQRLRCRHQGEHSQQLRPTCLTCEQTVSWLVTWLVGGLVNLQSHTCESASLQQTLKVFVRQGGKQQANRANRPEMRAQLINSCWWACTSIAINQQEEWCCWVCNLTPVRKQVLCMHRWIGSQGASSKPPRQSIVMPKLPAMHILWWFKGICHFWWSFLVPSVPNDQWFFESVGQTGEILWFVDFAMRQRQIMR